MILCYGCNDNLKLNTFHTLLTKWNIIIEYLEVFDAQCSVQKQSLLQPHNPKIFQMVVFIQRHNHVISTLYENSFK